MIAPPAIGGLKRKGTSKAERPVRASTIFALIIASLIVGLALDALGLTPVEFWQRAWSTVAGAFNWAAERLDAWLITILVGASIVVPVYLIMLLVRKKPWRRRR